jgi:hypothetical protein
MIPKMIPDKPSPFNLDLSKKAPGASQAAEAGQSNGAKDLKKFGDSTDKGIGSVINGLFQSAFGEGSAGTGQGQVGMLGDFDSEAFVESTLRQAQGQSQGGDGITKIIGSLMKMFAGAGG